MQANLSSIETSMRFSVLHRFLHLVVMIGFTGLAVTGFALAFSATWPARAFMWLVGGPGNAAWLHRASAVMTYMTVIVHGMWFLYYKFALRGRLTGPHSIIPNLKDLKDLRHNLGYFFGRRPSPPGFDKFSYMEKIDYWAVFLGMQTMGLTGLVLWFPEFFTRLLPGFFINLAQVLHFYEALLAVIIKIFIHVGMVHLRPAIYPADMSIFTGRATVNKLHPHGQSMNPER
jgi:cytochrome b subunit of formate dehydrogenase